MNVLLKALPKTFLVNVTARNKWFCTQYGCSCLNLLALDRQNGLEIQ